MDPNANLEEQVRLSARITAIIDKGTVRVVDGGLSRARCAEVLDSAARLAELVVSLHEWMANGGFAPDAWKKKP